MRLMRPWLVGLAFVATGAAAAPPAGPAATPSPGPAAGAYELYVQPSWVMPARKTGSREELVFRRYAFSDDLSNLPNTMAFACQKNAEYDSYLTIEIPKNYGIQSFKRSAEFAKIDIRFTIDGRHTFVASAEYINGKIYLDRTPVLAEQFDGLINAKDLIVEFGTGDLLRFHLLDNVEEFIKDPTPVPGAAAKETEDRRFVDTPTMLDLCKKYQQGQPLQ